MKPIGYIDGNAIVGEAKIFQCQICRDDIKLVEKIKRYEEALKFYASQDYLSEYNSVLFEDGGFKAKEALETK